MQASRDTLVGVYHRVSIMKRETRYIIYIFVYIVIRNSSPQRYGFFFFPIYVTCKKHESKRTCIVKYSGRSIDLPALSRFFTQSIYINKLSLKISASSLIHRQLDIISLRNENNRFFTPNST